MFKSYCSTYEGIFFSGTSLRFFDRNGGPCSCRFGGPMATSAKRARSGGRLSS